MKTLNYIIGMATVAGLYVGIKDAMLTYRNLSYYDCVIQKTMAQKEGDAVVQKTYSLTGKCPIGDYDIIPKEKKKGDVNS